MDGNSHRSPAYELVEDGLSTTEDSRDFTFANAPWPREGYVPCHSAR